MGTKITDLTALATAPDTLDVIAIVDVSDNIPNPSGTTKKITIADLGFLASGDNISLLNNDSGFITASDYSNSGEAAAGDRDLGNTNAFALSFITNGVGRLHIEAGGDVGIGTSTPTEKLEVAGNTKITGGIDVDSSTFFVNGTSHAWSLGRAATPENDIRAVTIGNLANTFNSGSGSRSIAIGENSTAIATGANSTIAVGSGANAIGNSGIIIGTDAGSANTTSQGNDIILIGRDTGNGVAAMALENIFIGKAATGTSAQGAVGIGADTNVNGNFSAALGFRTEADGLSSIALGDRVKATATESYIIGSGGAATVTNSVASSLAVAFGTNIAFRFSESADSYLNGTGNVGIGTTTPSDKLEVSGNLNATRYKVNGVAGANFSGAVTNITVVDGIVTAVS